MLSDRYSELLTAYLDGELSARQRRAVLRLLRRSPEARKLLQQLQRDAHALGRLPARRLPAEFPLRVLRAIAERGLEPAAARPTARPRGIPAWVGLAAAAVILLAVTAVTFLAVRGDLDAPAAIAFRPDPSGLTLPELAAPNPLIGQVASGALTKFAGEPGIRIALATLAKPGEATRLATELRREPAYHVDLEPGHSTHAVARLAAAFQDSGIELIVGSAARARMAKKEPKARYVVYAENLRPDELASILAQLGRPGKNAPPAQRTVLLNPMTATDRGHLAKLLGVQVADLQPAKKLAPGQDLPVLRDPIVVPEGKQGPKGKAGTPAPREPERFAVLLPYSGTGHGGASAEVRRFLSRRRPPAPGTLQVYFVVHEARA